VDQQASSTAAPEQASTTTVPEQASTTTVPEQEEEPPDLAVLGYVNNLLEKEKDGEWTRGEGLVATLEVFAGERDEVEILRYPELVDYEGTGIIAMARDYLEDGTDPEARAEIEGLLDQVIFSNERLEAMAGIGSQGSPQPGLSGIRASRAAEEDCREFFREHKPEGVGACLEVRTLYVLDVPGEGPYRVFVPAPSYADAGWKELHYNLALKAMEDAVVTYSRLEGVDEVAMPPVNLVFSVAGDGYAMADPLEGEQCGVVLYTKLQTFERQHFKHVVAHELAHCFQTERFVEQNKVRFGDIRWREEGLAEFLANVVYPRNNLEWDPRRMLTLTEIELTTTLFERAYTNFMLFQFLYFEGGGIPGIFNLVDSLPTIDGLHLQKNAMAAYAGMFPAFHEFMKTVTDEQIEDSGGGYGDYRMTEDNHPTVSITSPGMVVAEKVEPFGGLRRHLVVPEGKQACLTWDATNLFVENRPNPEGEWVDLPTLLPMSDEESGDVDLVVTSMAETTFALVVASVHRLDEETDGTVLGEWIVDNNSIRPKVGWIAPVQRLTSVSGQIRVTFRDDGTVRLVYSGFEVAGSSEVAMQMEFEDGVYTSDFTSTFRSVTNAEGVDGYRVTGDYIFYDSLSEGDFLVGTETVTRTSAGLFWGVEVGDIEFDVEIPEDSTDEYPASGWAFLGAANQLRFACGGNVMLLDSVVLRRAA